MSRRTDLLIAWLLLCSAAWAQPDPLIDGPTEARPGDIVLLDASESDATHFAWAVDLSGVNVPEEGGADLSEFAEMLRAQGFDVSEPPTDDGRPAYLVLGERGNRLQLSSYPGVYRVTMACSDETGVAMTTHSVTVEGGVPPDPDPDPDPDPPEPLTEFSRHVRDAVRRAGGDAEEWRNLADLYELLALSSPALDVTVEEFVEVVRESSRKLLSENLTAWEGVVSDVVGPHLNSLRDAGRLETVADHVEPFKQIAKGIREGAE